MQKRHVTVCLILLVIVGTLFLVRPMIFPCLMSIIVAYLFNPLVVNFEKHKIPRLYSVIFIILALLMVFVLAITFILPVIYVQITSILNFLVSKAPSLNLKIIPSVLEFFNIKTGDGLFDHLSKNLAENYSDYISYFINAFDITGDFIIQVLSSSFSLIHTVSLVVITPVIFFYVLRDWPLIIAKVSELIPVPYREKVTDYFSKVDFVVSNYLKGQVNVCVVMMIFYSVGLGIIGLKHSVAIGILSGMLTFIPYIGPLIYTTIGFLSAIAQFSGWFESAAVLLLFGAGQLIDANILVPLLIGKKVHIHPAVIILGMATCASYFGLTGVLLFIPIIAVFNVSVRYAVDAYLQSEFYKRG
ncbi:AI-2E family transporter [Wolbachia endosymbiont of Ctenocephalides felis wCfeJ]|uniref:AI-2E family transporter n=1 Tax=Wolbachia endosymbiont of Ctenocephalides felis wCfeJ TaxID=2732594 RepID=UPI001446E8E4|nr:AI-2E family transporter [Wolbachia endosymbiont of Ctenocephalides felis wCfeJ]WCR58561.1 MAG: Putative transport protein [Wolbachia endosymbiont of Ctenocephalides felis wCfeJ]